MPGEPRLGPVAAPASLALLGRGAAGGGALPLALALAPPLGLALLPPPAAARSAGISAGATRTMGYDGAGCSAWGAWGGGGAAGPGDGLVAALLPREAAPGGSVAWAAEGGGEGEGAPTLLPLGSGDALAALPGECDVAWGAGGSLARSDSCARRARAAAAAAAADCSAAVGALERGWRACIASLTRPRLVAARLAVCSRGPGACAWRVGARVGESLVGESWASASTPLARQAEHGGRSRLPVLVLVPLPHIQR